MFLIVSKTPQTIEVSIGLGFFKNYHKDHKDIKAICEEYEKDFYF